MERVKCIWTDGDKSFTVGKIYDWPNPKDNDGCKRSIDKLNGCVWKFEIVSELYVECLEDCEPGIQFTKGKIYKVKEETKTRYNFESDDKGSNRNGWDKNKFKLSTKEAYDRQNTPAPKFKLNDLVIWAINENENYNAIIRGFNSENDRTCMVEIENWKGHNIFFTNYYHDENMNKITPTLTPNKMLYVNLNKLTLINNYKLEVMKTFPITRSQFQSIYDIACAGWKTKITIMVQEMLGTFGTSCELSYETVDSMFKAANTTQTEVLVKIFPGYSTDKSVNLTNMEAGDIFRKNGDSNDCLVTIRKGSEFKNKAFFLSNNYTWEMNKDAVGDLCLIPTRK